MDLADIRKKGLKKKDGSAEKPDAEGRAAEPSAPPVPAEPESKAPEPPVAAQEDVRPERKAEEPAETTPEVGLVTFFLGSEGYAVSVEEVQEVVPSVTVVPIPRTGPEIAGLFSLRGAMIPLFRVRTILDLGGEGKESAGAKFLVVLKDDFPAAMPIDRLGQVLTVREGAIKPPPPFLKGIRGEYLRGIVDVRGQVFGILNLARILPSASRAKGKEKEQE